MRFIKEITISCDEKITYFEIEEHPRKNKYVIEV